MIPLDELLSNNHGVATLAQLEAGGVSAYHRARAIARGDLIRVRNGWFAAPDAAPDLVRATRIGGRLTCVSALALRGLWTLPDPRLHVSLARNSARLRAPDDRHSPLARNDPMLALHWRRYDLGAHTALDPTESAVAHLIRCTGRDSAIVTVDSALNRRLTHDQLANVLASLPAKYGRLAS